MYINNNHWNVLLLYKCISIDICMTIKNNNNLLVY